MPATTHSTYFVLFTIAAVLSCPFMTCAGWFFFDGVVTYPDQRTRALEYERIQREHPDEWRTVWSDTANAQGWPSEDPGPARTPQDILTQYILGSVCSLFSLCLAVAALVFGLLIRRDKAKQADTHV